MAISRNGERIQFVTRNLVACAVMMWGVINLVHNFLHWNSIGWPESNSLLITIGFCLLTGVLPFCIGVWALIRIQTKDS